MNDPFAPDTKTETHYKAQVKAILAGSTALQTIDMGSLPKLYTELGIGDETLKTNATTLLKALGLKGQNKHHVPEETLENLLSLVHDPEAVFKSLSGADNPNGYVAVLKAQAKDEKPIVAILSPSKDGKGFTFIPSVYERNNFERFVKNVKNEGKILYIKEKGSALWGRQQSPPRHNAEPASTILTKEDIVKRILQKNNRPDRAAAEARKAGFVQGICECALIVKQKDTTLAKELLKETGVSPDTARKYAEPETCRELEQGLFPRAKLNAAADGAYSAGS